MSRSLHVDSDLVRALVSELSAAADQAGRDLTELKSVLARQGEPWGDDEPGQQIGEAYVPQADQSLEGYANLVDNLRRLSTEIGGAAETFDQQDQDLGNLIGEVGNQFAPNSAQPGYPTQVTPVPFAQSPQQPESAYPGDTAANTAGQPTTTPAPSTQSGDPSSTPTHIPTGYDPSGMPTSDKQPSESSETSVPQGNQAPAASAPANAPGAAAQPSAAAADPGRARTTDRAPESSPRAGSNSAAPRKNTQTPWSRGSGWSPPTGATRRPNSPGSPWSRSGPGTPRLGRVFGPEPGGPGAVPPNQLRKNRKDKARKDKQRAAAAPDPVVPTDAKALESARAMAERHGLRLSGFDTSGIGIRAAEEIAAALDDLLGKYPFVELSGLEITELGNGRVSEVRMDPPGEPGRGPRLLLDRTLVANPARLAVAAERAVRSGKAIPESAERPLYSAVVADFGRILATPAGSRLRRSAQRALITEYHRISGPWSGRDTLAHVVHGYRRWRDALGGGVTAGRFDPEAALVAAFTEVELRGTGACGPAKVLHLLVVEGARGRSSSR
ncbi:WXG100 family type VII secretion target [Nocardia wallacei]|uniref:WXG100 family type VII secretion target n=1 Tax=Nocardia wallacei TaxID=480035 RepID=UPI002455EB17|nr:hypothetical protein [Nocardia wallacei]